MPVEYVNRCSEPYFLLQGKTKTGKPKYSHVAFPQGAER
jgi:hypothetical protein